MSRHEVHSMNTQNAGLIKTDKTERRTRHWSRWNDRVSNPPCLTPLDTWNGSEKCLPHFICIVCSLYQCFSRRTKHIGTFLWISFSSNFMCSTRSNAFETSKNTAWTDEPWVTKYEAVCFNKNVHWSVLWLALKPNWLWYQGKERR